ncbi:MAG: DegQ family serine endoprotease [Gammaproteobacteria bacterium]|nr:DegQ family serine endoprotease [Gammaproteobacteria bacterium]NIR84797.1 DegQ family serine endoprotease [Gammaproteobacteria bacterium]NIR91511.1 DegQ family serine endoprotease [Gammaproteobacteria bacterium]NIU05844.1 DegQ family serine endoprotease [Gammaproteobacteria bacterium]NIV76699.1 Do family serine endopeptidase [Gammaproteobacteria bacterium]
MRVDPCHPFRCLAAVLVVAGLASALPANAALPLLEDDRGVPTLAPVLENVTPAVVNISVISRAPAQQNPLFQDPFFRRFFDMPELQPRPQQSAGSGVIIDAGKGYVISNHHVVKNAEEVVVTLKDQREFQAELVGSDPGTDIALLKIEPVSDVRSLHLGNSDELKVGDFVVAVGNPFGLGQTVTSGIISALGRSGLRIEGYEDFIQTDAPINPGNSGGALVNFRGELIGINTAIIGPAGGNVGIGFAVPSNMARAVVAQLIRYGEVRRGRLGVLVQDLTPDLASALGIDRQKGAVVTQVEEGSPAERAGVQAGDIVVAVNDGAVESAADLRNEIGLIPIGEAVTLTVMRDSQRRQVRVRIGEVQPERVAGEEATRQLSGAVFSDIQPGSPLHGQVEGVEVSEVERGSPAWRAGLREGDVILSVNREQVTSVAQLKEALRQAASENRAIALNIARGGARLFIVIR